MRVFILMLALFFATTGLAQTTLKSPDELEAALNSMREADGADMVVAAPAGDVKSISCRLSTDDVGRTGHLPLDQVSVMVGKDQTSFAALLDAVKAAAAEMGQGAKNELNELGISAPTK